MLISRVPEDESGAGEGHEGSDTIVDHAHEYQTASELFDLMARNQNFQPDEDETLTTRDLVLLYKNIDLGTKLMSNANEFKRKSPNQYVETIVYEDLESDSDLSEIYSTEDIHNVVLVNKERIDLLNNPPSLENTLCHKLGDLEIHSSDLTTQYDRKYLIKDSYIKDQLKNLNILPSCSEYDGSVLPASLLDYICCKRLEDNYNFYLDNIIKYVKHTIDQLKRISNGDYLTDKAKEKWKEVNEDETNTQDLKSKVLATSTSIPLYIERKMTGHATKWDDLVHSAVDIRSLSKILEKKIVIEVPKAICGSFKLFSKCYNDNLIISCKKDPQCAVIPEEAEESRVDVVLQLNRSDSGHVISNISSVMVLQKKPEITKTLPLPYKNEEDIVNTAVNDVKEKNISVTGSCEKQKIYSKTDDGEILSEKNVEYTTCPTFHTEVHQGKSHVKLFNNENDLSSKFQTPTQQPNYAHFYKRCNLRTEASCELIPSDELRLSIQRLSMQGSLPEEVFEDNTSFHTTNKRKSPTRKRIKSPYENKSFLIEEKKRKKLLEVRQRREKKKIALTENCKVNKHKYTKGVASPHTASSITKLSITNKSFYNSIYGHSAPESVDSSSKQSKIKGIKNRKDSILDDIARNFEINGDSIQRSQELQKQKYIDNSYYLDNPVTEVMYMEMKQKQSKEPQVNFSESTSAISNDFNMDLKIFSQLITPCVIKINVGDGSAAPSARDGNFQGYSEMIKNMEHNQMEKITSAHNIQQKVPDNSPKDEDEQRSEQCAEHDAKMSTSAEFRKSIDKIYELIKKLEKTEGTETKLFKSKFTAVAERNTGCGSSTIQYSDSGTSVKHHLASSNPSCFSFDKTNNPENSSKAENKKSANGPPTTVVPKVIISTKSQTAKVEEKINKKDRKKNSPTKNYNENPLRAISQLLHEFDNVQKIRTKSTTDAKISKKSEVNVTDGKADNVSRGASKHDNHMKDSSDQHSEKCARAGLYKDRRPKPPHAAEPFKYPHQPNHIENKPTNRSLRKKVVDIVDELKEAKGQAVRGPSKLNSRLNSLAQPKRTYVQAQIEEFQARYGKSIVTDRLRRLNAAPPSQVAERSGSPKHKKKNNVESDAPVKQSPSASPVLEKNLKKSTSANGRDSVSPTLVNEQCAKHSIVVETPQNLKKKMVAVESYLKNHYGRLTAATDSGDLMHDGLKSRVPLLPNDLDLPSISSPGEESSAIESKIHNIIDTMLPSPLALSVLTECNENSNQNESSSPSVSESSLKKDEAVNYENYSCYHHSRSTEMNDPLINFKHEGIVGDIIPEESDLSQDGEEQILTQSQNSLTELEKLENALYRRMSIGAFQKRLRLKNLTLTPKESTQQVLLLQSGDTNSVVLKSTLSKIKNVNNDGDLKTLTDLPKLDWSFAEFPMQISTVGYSFPHFQHLDFDLTSNNNNSLCEIDSQSEEVSESIPSLKSDKTSQCYKGGQSFPECAAQVDVKEFIRISSVLKISSTLITEKNDQTDVKKKEDEIHDVKNDTIKNVTQVMTKPTVAKEISIQTFESETNESTTKTVQSRSRDVDYTTSLDILVGLLNEIQKITTCQTQITTPDAYSDTEDQKKDIEHILKSTVALESVQKEARNIISISSLDKLRQLESNPSIYSFYLSNNGDKDFENKLVEFKPLFADKEVDAIVHEREFVNRCTDVPSRLFPITVSHSTSVSNTVLGVLSESSSQSVFAFNEHAAQHNSSYCKNIITLQKDENPKNYNNHLKKYVIKDIHMNENIQKPKNIDDQLAVRFRQIKPPEKNDKKVHKKKGLPQDANKQSLIPLYSNARTTNNQYVSNADFDPVMKMKRDILVTMYSVLVLTVFAALSFPEMLYRA
ncbi:uncharacterized protein LOC126370820 [Pectinophora gossypiella]|uniref:uncharacterized protein LOC126370820 n=1 Tax=Pectinophora gossypiella TaxID=13191 RepID=UPI00214DF206|nr:uncharacterized protein LOC126370820 [Pectinophora gossypiella]